jgi:hypothetical protein
MLTCARMKNRVAFLTQSLMVVTHLLGVVHQGLILACKARLDRAGMLATYGPGCAGLGRKYTLSKWTQLFGIGVRRQDRSKLTKPSVEYGGAQVIR